MDVDDLRAVMTVVMFLAFVAIVLWAYSGRQKSRFDAAARLPFEEEQNWTTGERR